MPAGYWVLCLCSDFNTFRKIVIMTHLFRKVNVIKQVCNLFSRAGFSFIQNDMMLCTKFLHPEVDTVAEFKII